MPRDSPAGPSCKTMGHGPVFYHNEQEEMNVAALLKHLRGLRRAGKTSEIVELALTEAEALHEGGNQGIDYESFVRAVGRRVQCALNRVTTQPFEVQSVGWSALLRRPRSMRRLMMSEFQNECSSLSLAFSYPDAFFPDVFLGARRVQTLEEIFAESFARSNKTTTATAELSGEWATDDDLGAADDHAAAQAVPASRTREPDSPSPAPAAHAPAPADTLWTVRDAATFLRKSPRWIFYALQTPENEPGSIPHSKLGRNPRFIPDDLRTWAAQGFPPAGSFKLWKEADAKRARRH